MCSCLVDNKFNNNGENSLIFFLTTAEDIKSVTLYSKRILAFNCRLVKQLIGSKMGLKQEPQAYLNTACQHLIKNVCSFLHDPHVDHRGVSALAILDGVDKTVPELFH